MAQRHDPDLSQELHPALEESYRAEAAKFEQEGKLLAASAAAQRAEALYFNTEAKLAQIDLRAAHRRENLRNQTRYYYTQDVDEHSVRKCMKRLAEWDHDDPECEVEIIFTSPGGSCIDGLALWDYLMEFRNKGHHLITHTLGMAASMAGVLLQAGGIRRMGQESYLLIHEMATTELAGKLGVIEDELAFMQKMQDRIYGILCARSILTKDEVRDRAHRRDWWMSSSEALDNGFIDEVI